MSAYERAAQHERRSYDCYLRSEHREALAARELALGEYESVGDAIRQGDTHRWLSRLAWFVGDNGKVVEWTSDKGYTIRTKAFTQGYVHGGDIVEVRSIAGSGPNDMWAASSDGLPMVAEAQTMTGLEP